MKGQEDWEYFMTIFQGKQACLLEYEAKKLIKTNGRSKPWKT